MNKDTTIELANHLWSPWSVKRGPDGTRVKTSGWDWKHPLKWDRWASLDKRCLEVIQAEPTTCTSDLVRMTQKTRMSVSLSLERLVLRDLIEGNKENLGGWIPLAGSWRPPTVSPSLCDIFEDWDGPIVDVKGRRLVKNKAGNVYHVTPAYQAQMGERPVRMDDIRHDFFDLIDQTRNLTYILATKRPENIRPMWGEKTQEATAESWGKPGGNNAATYRPNCWLLYSASDQASLEAGIGHLLKCRGLVPILGLSLEPLIGPIDLKLATPCDRNCGEYQEAFCPGTDGPCIMQRLVDWVIVGGESGPNARPCQLEWILDIVEQCRAAGVPCFVKQLGSNPVTNVTIWDRITCVMTERIIDDEDAPELVLLKHPKGGDPEEWPKLMRVQQHPEVT